MKHFLSFCFALCSIVLAAFNLTPTYAGQSLDSKQEMKFSTAVHTDVAFVSITPVNFSPGNLPERISLPDPVIKDLPRPKSEAGMDDQNRKLKALTYKDANPQNLI